MFGYAFDIVEASAVFVFAGERAEDSDFERYIAAFQSLDAKAVGRDSPIAVIMTGGDHLLPNAIWRKRIAQAASKLRSNPLMIVVSASMLARGIVQAIQWINPLPFDAAAARSFEEAVAVGEKRRRKPLPELRKLLAEAEANAVRSSGHLRTGSG
ncbi:MAG: hypothetical protein U0235_08025 [Polyangiaceae bacterium]